MAHENVLMDANGDSIFNYHAISNTKPFSRRMVSDNSNYEYGFQFVSKLNASQLAWIGYHNSAQNIFISPQPAELEWWVTSKKGLRIGATSMGFNGNTVWHAGNDGSGSGLDADLLDGRQSDRYIYSTTGHSNGTSNWTALSDYIRSSFVRDNNNSTGAGQMGIFVCHSDSSQYGFFLGTGYGTGDNLIYRHKSNGTWGTAYTLLSSNNYSSYVYSKADADSRYVNVTGDTMSGTLNMNGTLTIKNNGKIAPAGTSVRTAGMYGVYDPTKTALIWSMGEGYSIDNNGAGFGNLYGFAYKHTNNATGGTMADDHQAVWCQNGIPHVALGKHIWAKNQIIAQSYIFSNNGYIVAKKGWFQNDTINVGLYNSNRDIRWYATVNESGHPDTTEWYADSSIRAKDFVVGKTFISNSSRTITITGDKDTFYPVHIRVIDSWNNLPMRICISKKIGSTSNSGWAGNHTSGTSSLTICWEGRQNGWDGNNNYTRFIFFLQPHAPLVGDFANSDGSRLGWVVWLRGGTATYEIYSTYELNINVYYSRINVGSTEYPRYIDPLALANKKTDREIRSKVNQDIITYSNNTYSIEYGVYGGSGSTKNSIYFYYNDINNFTSVLRESASGRLSIPGKLAVGASSVNDSYALSATSFYSSGNITVNGVSTFSGTVNTNAINSSSVLNTNGINSKYFYLTTSSYGYNVNNATWTDTHDGAPWYGMGGNIAKVWLSGYVSVSMKCSGAEFNLSGGTGRLTGNFVATGEVTSYTTSDMRLKKDISTLTYKRASNILSLIRPVSFRWNNTAFMLNKQRYKGIELGVVAQEIQGILPCAIKDVFEHYMSVDYTKLIPPIIAVVNEHEKEIQRLKKEVEMLKLKLKLLN